MKLIDYKGPARTVETNGTFEVSMYGFHVATFTDKEEALVRMRKEAGGEKRYAYK
jgi:hypothetical protein